MIFSIVVPVKNKFPIFHIPLGNYRFIVCRAITDLSSLLQGWVIIAM